MTKLFLVRHGETELNSAERYWGHSDVKLSALGLWQAGKLRDHLTKERFDAIYSSDLKRALATARIIASRRDLEIITCIELREINFGKLEGLNFAEISRLFPDFAAGWRAGRDVDMKFPGGESLSQLNARVGRFVARLAKHNNDAVLVVAHAGVLRTLICQLMDLEMRGIYQFRLDLASLSIVETHPIGAILNRLNDVCHLR